jgi:hypothetical protein
MLGEGAKSRMLVAPHDRRVARDIAKHDRGKLARWSCLRLSHLASYAPTEADLIKRPPEHTLPPRPLQKSALSVRGWGGH